MSEWDTGGSGGFDSGSSGGFDGFGSQPANSRKVNTGGLNTAMCIVCLISVSAVSFLMAWLMRDVVRSFWQMGLTFAAPFAALMVSSFMVERNTHLMTPATSMGSQRLFALATIVVAFAVGCLTVLLHDPVTITLGGEYDYVLVIDKSSSMDGVRDTRCREAVRQLISELPDGTKVGTIAFSGSIKDVADIAPLNAAHRQRISDVINTRPSGGTDFNIALRKAQDMVNADTGRTRPVRIILISDGEDRWGQKDSFVSWADRLNNQDTSRHVELCGIQIGKKMPREITDAANATGGSIIEDKNVDELASHLTSFKSSGGQKDVDILKATYNGEADQEGSPNTTYIILSAVLLVLLGVLTGFSMMVMFSARGQFRAQVILSAVAGILAFLLLNFGKSIGISPAWVCEAIAFSLFGLVFMNQNLGVSGSSGKIPDTPAASFSSGGFDDF